MRVGYVDTSVVVALTFGESGSKRFARLLGKLDRVFSSTLLESELMAAADREGLRDRAHEALGSIHWVHPDRRLTPEIHRVLDAGRVRGADLHHLATALYLFGRPSEAAFLTMDTQQSRISRALGFSTGA